MLFACVIMVLFTSCRNIEKDGAVTLEKLHKWSNLCISTHIDSDVEETIQSLKSNLNKNKKNKAYRASVEAMYDKFNKSIDEDADLLITKCLDPLFDKYGEEKTLEWVNKQFNDYVFTSKEELYSITKKCIKKEYSDGYDSKLRVKVIELESELISKNI